MQTQTITAKVTFEHRQIQTSQISDRPNAQLGKPFFHHFAHSRQTPNRQERKKCIDVFGLDDEESIRFAPVRSDLCQKFVRRYAR